MLRLPFLRAAANTASKQRSFTLRPRLQFVSCLPLLPLPFPLPPSPFAACSRVDFGNKVFDKLFGLAKGHGA